MTTAELKAKIETAASTALIVYAQEYPGKRGIRADENGNPVYVKGTYIYAIRDIQNMNYDSPLPHIYCEELTVRKNFGSGVIEWPNISMAFLDQDTMDSSAEQMESIKDRMEFLADTFQSYLLADDALSESVTFDLAPISKVNMGMFSGYGVTFTIRDIIEC